MDKNGRRKIFGDGRIKACVRSFFQSFLYQMIALQKLLKMFFFH